MTRPEWMGRVARVVEKELRQIFRDFRMRAFIFIAPVIQLFIFGYAVSTDVRNTRLFVVDDDATIQSRSLVEAMTASGYFRVVGASHDPGALVAALDGGDAVAGLVISPGFQRDLARGNASVQLILDGTNSNVATVARGYAERILVEWGRARGAGELRPAIDLRERAWFNADLESRNYNVPGVAGLIIFLICLLLTSLAVVREREAGTLEQLMVSPLRPWELILGKSLPVAAIGMVDLVVVTAIAIWWFEIPFRGSALLLFAASLLYIVAGLGIGLFLSTVSSTQQEAFMAMFLVFMPAILLAGFMFPARSMPVFFQWVTLVNPIRHYLVIVRAIFLKGAGFTALWPHFLALLLIGAAIFSLAAARFEKRIG